MLTLVIVTQDCQTHWRYHVIASVSLYVQGFSSFQNKPEFDPCSEREVFHSSQVYEIQVRNFTLTGKEKHGSMPLLIELLPQASLGNMSLM